MKVEEIVKGAGFSASVAFEPLGFIVHVAVVFFVRPVGGVFAIRASDLEVVASFGFVKSNFSVVKKGVSFWEPFFPVVEKGWEVQGVCGNSSWGMRGFSRFILKPPPTVWSWSSMSRMRW